MRKAFIMAMAITLIFGVAFTAQAKNTVQMTLTSPTILGQGGCEKAGAASFGFDGETNLVVGDWWYMDLPIGATLCKSIDYIIAGNIAGSAGNQVFASQTDYAAAIAQGGASSSIQLLDTTSTGPMTVTDKGAGAAAAQALVTGNVVIRVKGDTGSRRVSLYVAGNTASPGNIYVRPQSQMLIKILDGKAWRPNDAGNTGNTVLLRPESGATFYRTINGLVTNAGLGNTIMTTVYGANKNEVIVLDASGTTYTAKADGWIDPTYSVSEPYVENTLCVTSNGLTELFTSFASKDDKYTFTGDSQIAHTGSVNPVALAACSKKDLFGEIKIADQGSCQFDYDDTNVLTNGYCSTWKGNELLVKGTTTFGDTGDKYTFGMQILTPGVYWNATPVIKGYLPGKEPCDDVPGVNGTTVGVGTYTKYIGATETTEAFPTNSCSVTSTKRIDTIKATPGGMTGIDTFDKLYIMLAPFVYDQSIIGNGVEVSVRVTIDKYPCGTWFTGDRHIGTFVTTCSATTAGTTDLLYPWIPALDGSQAPWWGGFVINNGGTGAGTAVLTFVDVNGNKATLTTASIPAQGQWNFRDHSLAELTQDAANTAPFGSADFAIFVKCNFPKGAGFAFTGNGNEATGYVPYTTGW